jgi:hypothetical protein
MILFRILANGLVLIIELAAIAVTAYLAWSYPYWFSLATGLVALALGLKLEYARLANEYSFYFGRSLGARSVVAALYAGAEAIIKGLLAGLAALLTFSGTNVDRLWYVAVLFGATMFAGTSLLRWLSVRFGASPARWGYFRLAAMLGVLFSGGLTALAALGLIETPTLSDIVRTTIWDTAARPPVTEASELLFKLKQYLDSAIVSFLSIWVGPGAAQALGIVLSVNMLTGFVAAIYAVLIAAAMRVVDEALP